MRNFNNSYKLLAGALALVLVAGMTSPAFAQFAVTGSPEPVELEEFVSPLFLQLENLVYENGNPDPSNALSINFGVIANDFVLEEDLEITDLHFIFLDDQPPFGWDGPFQYEIRQDDNGIPGELISSGVGQNVETEEIEVGPLDPRFIVWLDLEEPIPLTGGITYWLVLHAGDDINDDTNRGMFWEKSDVIIGNNAVGRFTFDPDGWMDTEIDTWFQLTDSPLNIPIGGTSFPVSTTTLLVAGAQANMGLLSLALVGMVAAGAAIIYKTKSKKTEQ